MLCSLAQAQHLLTQVKISLVHGRVRQKQKYSPCQESLDVAEGSQESALSTGFRSSFK